MQTSLKTPPPRKQTQTTVVVPKKRFNIVSFVATSFVGIILISVLTVIIGANTPVLTRPEALKPTQEIVQTVQAIKPAQNTQPTAIATAQPTQQVMTPTVPAVFGKPGISGPKIDMNNLIVYVQAAIKQEAQPFTAGMQPVEISDKALNELNKLMLAPYSTGSRPEMLNVMQNSANWVLNAAKEQPYVEKARKEAFDTYRNEVIRVGPNPQQFLLLANYTTAMRMLAATPEETKLTETLITETAKGIGQEVYRQQEAARIANEQLKATQQAEQVATQTAQQLATQAAAQAQPQNPPVENPQQQQAPVTNPVPENNTAPKTDPAGQPKPQTQPANTQPSTTTPDSVTFRAESSFELPKVLQTTNDARMAGWGPDAVILTAQKLYTLLTQGTTGPRSKWVVFNNTPAALLDPTDGAIHVFMLLFVREDTLVDRFPKMPTSCQAYIQQKIQNKGGGYEDWWEHMECLNYMEQFMQEDSTILDIVLPNGEHQKSFHYGKDGYVDAIATLWVGFGRPPFQIGNVVESLTIPDILEDMFRKK